MLTQTIPKELTFTFTTMETLTPNIPSNPRSYFLQFSSKDEYLRKRSEWRILYKWLSQAIRHNKQAHKASARALSLIEHRMVKSGKLPGYGWIGHYLRSSKISEEVREEIKSRRKIAEAKIPQRIKTEWLDATDLLKIRRLMKEQSALQRTRK